MILKSLELKNFRVYKNSGLINFAQGERNITIIQGNNEVGKTTIMNAITWCLYNQEFHKEEGKKPIWNLSAEDDLLNGDTDEVEVILSMEDSDGNDVTFKRKLPFFKNDKGDVIPQSSTFSIITDDGSNTSQIMDTTSYLSKHLPPKLRKYFLFDGEQLENYFDLDSKENIKDSVKTLSQLNLLEKVIGHVGNTESKLLLNYEDINPILAKIESDIKRITDIKEEHENDLEQLKSDVEGYDLKEEELQKKIAAFGEDPEKLIEDQKEKINELEDIIDDIKNNEIKYEKYLSEQFLYIYGYDSLDALQEKGEYLRQNNYIPADYKKRFLKEMLKNHMCICGNPLEEGTEHYKQIEDLFNSSEDVTDIEEDVNKLLGSTSTHIENYPKDFKENLLDFRTKKKTLSSNKKTKEKELAEINELLDNNRVEEVKKLNKKLNSIKNSKKTDNRKIGALEKSISNLKDELKVLKKQKKEEEKKRKKLNEIERKLKFVQDVKDTTKRLKTNISNSIHNKLEDLTTKQFNDMHWKGLYDHVNIDKTNFTVTIFQKDGEEIVAQDLSKGGQLTLALSFMIALNSLSGFELPILIDTPMGRLDNDIKMNIANFLPKYAKDKQITLLVTGTEYDEMFRSTIYEYVGEEYKIEFSEDNKGISEVKQWE